MENIDTTISEVEGYDTWIGPYYPNGSPPKNQYIGQFPMSTPGSSATVGKATDSMSLSKPDSERWWSTKPYVPPLH